ncbi:MAG: TIGR03667 family PPOX class F420-dependent oxidoreductase [Actinomycetota bacterium]
MNLLDASNRDHVRAEERLRSELIAWLTTVGAGGRPQSTPVWFHWSGETFLMYSRPGRPKLANMAANPRVSLHLEGDRVGGDNVVFEGTAEILDEAPRADQVPEYIQKYASLIDEHGWTLASFAADYSRAIRITPTRVRIW